jgi:hypothetical protein
VTDAAGLRARGDRELAEELVKIRLVERVIARLDEQEDKGLRGVRRRLLAGALRVTASMSPELHAIVDECRTRLGIDIPIELYLYPSATFNAACIKPEAGRLFVLLSSSLLEAFRGSELRFVIGHELGHHLFGHHDIPVGFILEGDEKPAPELALKLFSWSRYAELSADRAGAACAADADGAASALFRLASGLRGDLIQVRIDELAAQVDELQAELADPAVRPPASDWFSTHPFSPLRVKALKLFADSVLARPDGSSHDLLEAQVQALMVLMEPSYLDDKSDMAETMRRLLFAGAIAVADASNGISEAEIAVFEKFFGEGSFTEKLDVAAIEAELTLRMAEAVERVPSTRRLQVLRDLSVVLRAEGMIDPAGLTVLRSIARGLEVSEVVIDQVLHGSVEPD